MNVPDVQAKREQWKETITPEMVKDLVFLDESGTNIDMTRRYGRALPQDRVIDSAPLNTPRTQTVLAAMSADGTIIETTYVGGTTGERFTAYLKDTLVPKLRPGAIVVMDNLRSHHVAEVQTILRESGHIGLYLPPYSPDLNPIEMMWSKLKSILRKWKIRDAARLPAAITRALSLVTPIDCTNWFAADGYCLT